MIDAVKKVIRKRLGLGIIITLAISLPLFVWTVLTQRLELREEAATCIEQCPGSDGVLRNCHPPEQDGTADESLCNFTGRVQFCGSQNYCCPATNGTWSTDMSLCETSTPTPSPLPKAFECGVCGGEQNIKCESGLTCVQHVLCTEPGGCENEPVVGTCLKDDGTSNCPTSTVPGDVDGNGIVNIVDIGIIIDNYGSSPPIDIRTDLNGDGVINIVDIGIVIDNYGHGQLDN